MPPQTGEGRANHGSTTYNASQIGASNTLRTHSGRVINLLGAQATGDRVELKVGRASTSAARSTRKYSTSRSKAPAST